MEFAKKRWHCMIAAMILALFSGIGYAWSVFQSPIIELFGWSLSSVSLTFTIQVLVSTLSPVVVGRLQKKIGVANYLRVGVAVYAAGLIAMKFTSSVIYLYIVFGLIVGVGLGMLYPCLSAYGARLFPEKTGMASGMLAAAYGFGAVIWAPAASALMEQRSVLGVFVIFGIIFAVGMMPLTFLIKEPPTDFAMQKAVTKEKGRSQTSSVNYTWQEMLRSYRYYVLVVILTIGATAGLMITGHASGILQENLAMTAATAAIFVGLLSVSNAAGRLIFGMLSDRIGRYNMMMIQFVLITVAMVALTMISGSVFIIGLMLISACYGGFAAMISPACADNFGLKYHAINYNFVYIAYGIAGVLGPQLAAGIHATSGGYTQAFITVAVMSIVGLALVILLRVRK